MLCRVSLNLSAPTCLYLFDLFSSSSNSRASIGPSSAAHILRLAGLFVQRADLHCIPGLPSALHAHADGTTSAPSTVGWLSYLPIPKNDPSNPIATIFGGPREAPFFSDS